MLHSKTVCLVQFCYRSFPGVCWRARAATLPAAVEFREVARHDWFCCFFEGETHLGEEKGVGNEMQVAMLVATLLAMAHHPELEQERQDLGKLEVLD